MAQFASRARAFGSILGEVSGFGASGVTVRILAVVYVVQACVGISLGLAYAVWLMYLA
jgi:hypothetical protein